MASFIPPINLKKWIDEHRHLLKPPVGNQQIYKLNDDFIVMIVGGPNARNDYHFNEGEEIFYQIEGDITVKIMQDGKSVDIPIREGEIFLLPPRIPHSPQRPANTIGLLVERYRTPQEKDAFMWFCDKCGEKLYEEKIALEDIVVQLKELMTTFYGNEHLRTCKKCGSVLQRPM